MKRPGPWLVIVGLLLLGAFWLQRELRAPRASGGEPPAADAVPERVELAGESMASVRDEIEAVSIPAPPAPVPEPPSDPWMDLLQGIVVDAQDAPVPGATVALVQAPSSNNTLLFQFDPEFRKRLDSVASAETGADGRFRFELPCGIPFDLEARASGHADGFAALHYAGEDVRIVLGTEKEVFGRLTRARDGGAIEGALVRVIESYSYATRETRSAADGSYRVPFSFEWDVYLEVLPREEEGTQWLKVQLDADGKARMDLSLLDGVAVVGRVTESGSGRALAGAIVGEGWQFRRTAVTDAEGRYRLPGIGGAGAYGISAKAKGHGQEKRLELPSAVNGEIRIDFELPPAWSASGRVVDRAGAPVSRALVVAGGSKSGKKGQQMERSACRSDADGRFRLEDLSPGWFHGLSVTAPGFATFHQRLAAPSVEGGEMALGELVLSPPTLVSGRVLGPDGAGVVDVEVTIQNEDDGRVAWSDSLGRFSFGDLPAGGYALFGSWGGVPTEPRLELSLGEGEIREGIELRTRSGRTLTGRVVDEQGRGIAHVNVFARLEKALDPEVELEQELYERTDANGAFRFDALPAGEYVLAAFPREGVVSDPDSPWLDGGIRPVLTDSAPVEIVLARGETIRGSVLDAAGAPVVNFSVFGRGANGERTLISGTDALGRFELTVARGTTWDLVVGRPLQGHDYEKALLTEQGVSAGTQQLELRLSP